MLRRAYCMKKVPNVIRIPRRNFYLAIFFVWVISSIGTISVLNLSSQERTNTSSQAATSCTAKGGKCSASTNCNGTIVASDDCAKSGVYNPSGIGCCIPKKTTTCSGKCTDITKNTCSNGFKTGLCPGGTNNQCCTGTVKAKITGGTAAPAGQSKACTDAGGKCGDPKKCQGTLKKGICPGGTDNVCCIAPKIVGTTLAPAKPNACAKKPGSKCIPLAQRCTGDFQASTDSCGGTTAQRCCVLKNTVTPKPTVNPNDNVCEKNGGTCINPAQRCTGGATSIADSCGKEFRRCCKIGGAVAPTIKPTDIAVAPTQDTTQPTNVPEPTAVVEPTVTIAPTLPPGGVPNPVCLGSCPTPTLEPGTELPTVEPTVDQSQPIVTPAPGQTDAPKGLWERFLDWLKKLFEFLGIDTGETPAPNPTPAIEATPIPSEEPTAEPTEEIAPSDDPAPTTPEEETPPATDTTPTTTPTPTDTDEHGGSFEGLLLRLLQFLQQLIAILSQLFK